MTERIIITGGSGFLGTQMAARLSARGFSVVSLDLAPPRNPDTAFVRGDMSEGIPNDPLLEHPYAVINLAGVPIFGKWTEERKHAIYDSRVVGTKNLVASFADPTRRPKYFVSASAVGFYGDRSDSMLDVTSPAGDGFLAAVCRDWETEARRASVAHGVPTTIIRNGHILGLGGILSVLLPWYRKGLGGPLGNGKQWMPWIHLDDCAELYVRAAVGESIVPLIIAASPELVPNRLFSKTVARVLRRPHIFFLPVFALRILYGEMADEMVTSQRVTPELGGYQLKFASLQAALADVIRGGK
jgi:hypothetical protein